MRRVVFDTNVLISARLSPGGAPGQLLGEWLVGRFELVVSPAILAELAAVPARSKFRSYSTEAEASAFVEDLRTGAALYPDPPPTRQGSRDPGDDHLLTLARAHQIADLVSGDPDLLQMKIVTPRVHTPRSFLDSLAGEETEGG